MRIIRTTNCRSGVSVERTPSGYYRADILDAANINGLGQSEEQAIASLADALRRIAKECTRELRRMDRKALRGGTP